MELDPRYCDVIVRRWQDWTGRKAHRDGDGVQFDELVPCIKPSYKKSTDGRIKARIGEVWYRMPSSDVASSGVERYGMESTRGKDHRC